MKKAFILLVISILVFGTAPAVYAQNVYVHAQVYDYYTDEPVQGQTIRMDVYYTVHEGGILDKKTGAKGDDIPIHEQEFGVTDENGYVCIVIHIPRSEYSGEPFTYEGVYSSSNYGPYTLVESYDTYSEQYMSIYPDFYVNSSDLDEDEILDDVEEEIAGQFQPVLVKATTVDHPELQAGLADFEYIVNNQTILKRTVIGGSTFDYTGVTNAHKWDGANWCSYGWRNWEQSSTTFYWLQLNDNIRHAGAPEHHRPLYYHVYKDANYYYVQYWYWFNMNDIRNQTNNDVWHEGDWEHISIRAVINPVTGKFEPDAVNLYQHEGGHTKNPNTEGVWIDDVLDLPLRYDPDTFEEGWDSERNHPVIFIASNSHASYFFDDLVYRMIAVWDAPFVGEDYHDEVDYSVIFGEEYGETGGDEIEYELFSYDYLVKLGETGVGTNISAHGYTYWKHAIPPPGNSKEWLGFIGQCGDWWYFNYGLPMLNNGTKSPFMPSRNEEVHEWKSFTFDDSEEGFGNDDGFGKTITWVNWGQRPFPKR
ncbi:hypothetical protein ACFL6L_03725 [candidate division KSB1 bacterium]